MELQTWLFSALGEAFIPRPPGYPYGWFIVGIVLLQSVRERRIGQSARVRGPANPDNSNELGITN
jgi:hypothetical protein